MINLLNVFSSQNIIRVLPPLAFSGRNYPTAEDGEFMQIVPVSRSSLPNWKPLSKFELSSIRIITASVVARATVEPVTWLRLNHCQPLDHLDRFVELVKGFGNGGTSSTLPHQQFRGKQFC
ncbi:hypothetical protein JTE90_023217 [Oedothorax gibbosus]|uniref:Uncharacterized protein n=1 Tax=Oedothorax gibbosus TaxID=931172 RepID=A0AAV6VKL0_9ARAC|nr:hypothetical protein JTE90_023217 [Oedothorax gibbosus]